MNIKKFVANSSREAIRMVKKEMGPEAVILETRTTGTSRGGSGESVERVEVTAAMDYEAPAHRAQEPVSVWGRESSRRWEDLESNLKDVRKSLETIEASSLLQPELYFNEALRKRYFWFRNFGLNAGVIRKLMTEMRPPVEVSGRPENDQMRECLLKVMRRIKFCKQSGTTDQRGIYSFIGPTGVGKTTTLAKLAALNAIQKEKRVALITVDTFRIAAIAQMETYARIMTLPFEVASNRKELRKAIKKHDNCDTIFIDTAGRSPKNHRDISSIGDVLQIDAKIHHYLVLSATTQYEGLVHADGGFGILPFQSYIFTKLDEVDDASAMLNFLMSKTKPVSYFTTGQQVPEDIEPASQRRLASMILSRRGVNVDNPVSEVSEYGSSEPA